MFVLLLFLASVLSMNASRWTNFSTLSLYWLDPVLSPLSFIKVRFRLTTVVTIFHGGKYSILSMKVGHELSSHRNVVLSYVVWLTATRTLKLMPHLWYQPKHIIYVPAFILFGYYFAVMKIYAALTLHEVNNRLRYNTYCLQNVCKIDRMGYSCWNWGSHRRNQRCSGGSSEFKL